MTNFERYKSYCSCIETTDLYTEWSFYNLIGSCLSRKVWFGAGMHKVFPNMYMVFVGPPGTGKTNAARVNMEIFKRLKVLDKNKNPKDLVNIAPDTTTVEALIAAMAKSVDVFEYPPGIPHAHCSLTFVSEELGSLFRENDKNLIRFLTQGWDAGDYKKETKNNGNDFIKNMCINFLAATTPDWMADAMSLKGLLNEGFIGRVLFISGGYPVRKTFFEPTKDGLEHLEYLVKYCQALAQISGECKWTTEAREFFDNWYRNDFTITNNDRKLQYYYNRKKINIMKLATLLRFSDGINDYSIGIEHIKDAMKALERIELTMHEAVSAVSKNPVHSIATKLHEFLKHKKRMATSGSGGNGVGSIIRYTAKDLWLNFADEGDLEIIGPALVYLNTAGKIRIAGTSSNGDTLYEAL